MSKNMNRWVVGLGVLWVAASVSFSQSMNTENTLKLDDPEKRPAAKIADVAWLAGSWAGDGLGGQLEELWSAPSAGTMVGAFKFIRDGKPFIYEAEIILEEANSLALRVKHFSDTFVAWEEKDKFVDFPLVKLTEDAVYFSGLTIRRDGPNRIEMFLAMGRDGEVTEQQWVYTRTPSPKTVKKVKP
jgi:hypothetical protein